MLMSRMVQLSLNFPIHLHETKGELNLKSIIFHLALKLYIVLSQPLHQTCHVISYLPPSAQDVSYMKKMLFSNNYFVLHHIRFLEIVCIEVQWLFLHIFKLVLIASTVFVLELGQLNLYSDMLQAGQPSKQGSTPSSSNRFFSSPQHPDLLLGLPSLLHNRYWGLLPRQ
jgi:hypothetical protein